MKKNMKKNIKKNMIFLTLNQMFTYIENGFLFVLTAETRLVATNYDFSVSEFISESSVSSVSGTENFLTSSFKNNVSLIKSYLTDPSFKRGLQVGGVAVVLFSCFVRPINAVDLVDEIKPKERTWVEYGIHVKNVLTLSNIYHCYQTLSPTTKTVGLFVLGSLSGALARIVYENNFLPSRNFYASKINGMELVIKMVNKKLQSVMLEYEKAQQAHTLTYDALNSLYYLLKTYYQMALECNTDVPPIPLLEDALKLSEITTLKPKI